MLACDAWGVVHKNLRAIALHIRALRGIERWGVGSLEQAFTAYKALPAAGESSAEAWWEVLFGEEKRPSLTSAAHVKIRAAKLIREHHPDTGDGNAERLHAVIRARDEALVELG